MYLPDLETKTNKLFTVFSHAQFRQLGLDVDVVVIFVVVVASLSRRSPSPTFDRFLGGKIVLKNKFPFYTIVYLII